MDTLKNLNQIEEEEDDDEEDDEDYVPSKEDLENDDDADKDDDDDGSDSGDSDDDEADGEGSVKKTKRRGRKRKISRTNDTENVSEDGKKELTSEEKKKKADDLWAELNSLDSPKTDSNPKLETKPSSDIKSEEKVYDFAGETVVIKETPKAKTVISSSSSSSTQPANPQVPIPRRSGLKDLVSNLGKKAKIGTLQKSKLDWDSFKREEGIEDELKQATLSKDGYVERQAFLSRADLRQFEIEKSIRSKIRKPQ